MTRDRSEYYKQYNARNRKEKARVDRIKKQAQRYKYREESDEEVTRQIRLKALSEEYYA